MRPKLNSVCAVVDCGSPLYNLNKYIANLLKFMSRTEIIIPRILPRFPTKSEMFPVKMTNDNDII